MTSVSIDPRTAALVLIDLQHGVIEKQLAPRSGEAVVRNAARLANRFRECRAAVVLVCLGFSKDRKDVLSVRRDALRAPLPSYGELVEEIGPLEGDVVITKRQWGAFYGTELDLALRRRNIRTIILGGIATNFGVESTARDAHERGYEQIFVEDAMTSLSKEAHDFTIKNIFPRIGRLCTTKAVLESLAQ